MATSSIITTLQQVSAEQALDWNGSNPRYRTLHKLLKIYILEGTISQGDKMPTELELGEAFGLSRITVKRAMDELAAEKLVERRRGRGTTVIYPHFSETKTS